MYVYEIDTWGRGILEKFQWLIKKIYVYHLPTHNNHRARLLYLCNNISMFTLPWTSSFTPWNIPESSLHHSQGKRKYVSYSFLTSVPTRSTRVQSNAESSKESYEAWMAVSTPLIAACFGVFWIPRMVAKAVPVQECGKVGQLQETRQAFRRSFSCGSKVTHSVVTLLCVTIGAALWVGYAWTRLCLLWLLIIYI